MIVKGKGNTKLGILGKDLFDLTYEFFHFKALFSNDDIEIEEKNYKHGEILTDFLNYDPTSFLEAVEKMKRFMEDDDSEKYLEAELRTEELLMQMPLYRDFAFRREQLAFRRAFFHEYRNFEDYQRLYEDLKQIDRYRWFVREMFYEDGKVERNKFPQLIYHNCIDAFVSGTSLGESHMVDPADTSVQYEWRKSKADGKPHIYEKMLFKRIIDFWYVDLFKAIMNQYSPKPCKHCGRFFLQEPGLTFEYCTNIAPGETEKTCRDIGATVSFQLKIKNNPIWSIYQRAYKKYHARLTKGTMNSNDFYNWMAEAEKLRDKALKKRLKDVDLEEYARRLNEV